MNRLAVKRTLISRITRRRPRLLVLALACLAFVTLTGCTGDQVHAAYLAANQEALLKPASTRPDPMQFVVEPGATARSIAEQLASAGLISDARLFEAYVRVNGIAGELEAGTFTLSPHLTIPAIASTLQRALAPYITVTAREGWRLEQTADALKAGGQVDGDEYRRLAADPSYRPAPSAEGAAISYDFLDERPAGATLEGYLFPDTYQLDAEGAGAEDLIRRQLNEFAARAVPAYRQAAAAEDPEPQGRTQETKLSLHEVITLASIVEREAVLDEERPAIAGVYLNRLAAGMKLDADPTVQYAMGYQEAAGSWWKTPVYLEEYASVDSPYNTYLRPGLPPGPIASPGLASIRAVLYPERHDYLYFVAEPGGTGRHAFSRTLEEHLQNVRRYQGQ